MQADSLTTADGLTLYLHRWLPEGEPRAALLLVHGLHEHGGRYSAVAEHLAGQGIAVYAPDLRGHGQSDGDTRSYFAIFDSALGDIARLFDRIAQAHSGLPVFVYGHSMGSLLALLFTLDHQDRIAGLVQSGTPLKLDSRTPGPLADAGIALAGLLPKLRAIAVKPTDVIAEPQAAAAYAADPLVDTKPMRLGMVMGIVREARRVRPDLTRLTLPLLVIHGGDDRVTPVSGAHSLDEHAASTDKTLKIYPRSRHEVHHDYDREAMIADLAGWLTAHC